MEKRAMEKIAKVSIHASVLHELEKYIVDENLQPGDKLPPQQTMCEMLGVSRTSLREALKMLEARNIIEIKNGKGVYIKNNATVSILANIEYQKEKEYIYELFEVRRMLEHTIIEIIIDRSTDEEINSVEETLNILMGNYHTRGDSYSVPGDSEFHMKLYSICHNRIIAQFLSSYRDSLDMIWNNQCNLDKVSTETIPYHETLFRYIQQRDTKKALRENDKILDRIMKELLKN